MKDTNLKKKRILQEPLDVTNLLKLLDKMYKYDPAVIVEDTEQTQFCPQMNRQMDR